MRTRVICAVLALILVLSLAGCAAERPQKDGRLQVVCTLFPYYDFVRRIGGDDVDVSLLVAAGREVHSFEPTPLDAIRVSEADVFICNGGESEAWVTDLLDAAGEHIGTVLAMMDHADLLAEELQEGMQVREDGEEDSDEIEYDEHIWTSPVIAMELCRVIGQALAEADPAHAEAYQARLDDYLSRLEKLDQDFRTAVAGAHRTTLVFGDRFPLLYFCKTYGLDYRAAFHGCAGDTEPSLATLKYLIDKVETEQIPAVYTIELSSRKIAGAISDATGAKIVTFQSCQTVSRADFEAGETYLSLMQRNVDALKEGLQ
ncbi:MAG: zinc ABC transporter substrate-binding protein [Oscillospiraceae bacterium]|nr:zinc ABC transporter substrate-binding protein [Oscillospiraceae bacterium]